MRMAGRGRSIRACIVVTGVTVFSIGRAAADLIVTVSGTVSETYNDNVGLVSQGERQSQDWITALTPQINVSDQGSRVQFNLGYSPSELIFAGDTTLTTLQQSLLSSGQVELLKDTFFFKEQASITPQFINGIGQVGPTTLTTNSNLQTVDIYQLSPFLRHRFGDITDAETTIIYGQVLTSGDTLAPLQNEELRQTLTSGADFGRFGWTLTGDATRDRIGTVTGETTPGGLLKDDLGRADIRYEVLPQLAATASGGYEQISFPTLVSPIRGPIWNAGFAYTPNPTISFSATYGRRYNAPDYEITASYAADLTKATLTYSETIETTSMLLLSNSSQLGFSSGFAINTTTGLPFTGNLGFGNIPGSPFSATDEAFLAKTLQATLGTTRGRNSYTVYVLYGSERTFEPPITETAVTASFDWGRNLWPNLTGHLSATYTHASFGVLTEYQQIYSVLGSLVYTLSARSAATFTFQRYDEQSDVASSRISNDILTLAYTRRF